MVVFGFGPFFRYVAPTVLRVSITFPARIAISRVYIVKVVSVLPKQFMGDDSDVSVLSVRVVEPCDKGVCRDYVVDL